MSVDRDIVLEKVRSHLAEELGVDAGANHGRDALSRRPRGRLARPLRTGDGARGHLWREDVRAGGRGHRHRRAGRGLRGGEGRSSRLMAEGIRATGRGGIEGRTRAASGSGCPERADRRPPRGGARAGAHSLLVGRPPRRLLRAPGVPRRQRPGPRDRGAPLRPPPALGHRPPDEGARAGRLGQGMRHGGRRAGPARHHVRAPARDRSTVESTSRRCSPPSGRWRPSASR